MDHSDPMIPDLQAAIPCEDVRRELNGMQSLIGVIGALPVPQLPARLLKFCIWARWTGGTGRFTQASRIVAPDDETVIGESSVSFELKSMEAHATNVNFFAGLTFQSQGTYMVEILLDDDLRTRFPIPVFVNSPGNNPS